MAEGRRMMRLARELEPEQFRTLLEAYQQLLTGVFAERGGRNVDASGDTAEESCSELCDAAEGGQTFMSQAAAGLLEEDELGDLFLRDVGEQRSRRSGRAVRAYELVA